jgi:glycosyltransferase involved in cell wall biosynthesis
VSKTQPLVSVIIPTKNSARTLDKCLKSIQDQTYPNIEIILVDNNSTDQTKEIARKFTDKVYNKGPERSAQRNYGVKKSKGEYVLVHDSDIYFHPDSVQECVDLALDQQADAVILPEKSIGEGYWTKVKAFERSFYEGNDVIEAVRFFSKEAYNELGGYDEDMYAGEDWDLTIRFRKNNYKIMRAKNNISHDEGRLNLFGSSEKKKYYAENLFKYYVKKNPNEFKEQMKFLNRFPVNKIMTKGIRHPILFTSMIVMKGLELYNSKKA